MYSLTELVSARFPSSEGFRVTETLVNDIRRELESTKLRISPVKIATRYGVPIPLVRFIMQEMPSPNTAFTKHSTDGWGKDSLRPFLIARKIAGEAWPSSYDSNIEAARDQYDAGVTEMFQGRDGDFILLYSMPRKRPANRICPYFSNVEESYDDLD